MSSNHPLPVTVVSGFLGAGKTSLVNHVLNNQQGLRFAVLVNDLAEVNVDARQLKSGRVPLSGKHDGLIELHNGCICCSLREEFVTQVVELAHLGRFDYLLVEATGVSEPGPVAAAFDFADVEGVELGDLAPLDTLVTVVDAYHFLADWDKATELRELGVALDEEDSRTQTDLLAEQVECANVLVLNKTDLVSASEVARLESILSCLNPEAEIVRSMFGVVPLQRVLATGLYDAGRLAEPTSKKDRRARARREAERGNEHGVKSFVYRARRPFHPGRLWDAFHEEWPGVLRSKGLFWLASRMSDSGFWSQAGAACSHACGGRWWAAVPEVEWPEDEQARNYITGEFRGPFGDRRQELVVIGVDIDEAALRQRLDACLLDEQEMRMGPMGWLQLSDPFPSWAESDDDQPGFTLLGNRPVPSA